MANRTLKAMGSVAASNVAVLDTTAIPDGKTIRFKKIIISEQNLGTSISSGVLVQWGTVGAFEEIFAGFVTGSTIAIDIDDERVGDGVKFVRITRQNNSAGAKRIMAWLTIFDL